MMTDAERAVYWEKQSKLHADAETYYRQQLADAHALLGRVIHQLSERWDSANLTQYFPTDNLHRSRTLTNPTGNKK
jgi:hypothetical protein